MMRKETDLESCKEVARPFLEFDIVTDPVFGEMMLHHPFFNSLIFMNGKGKLCNFINDQEAFEEAKAQVRSNIDMVKEFQDFSMILQKPYLLAFLKYTHFYISKEDLSKYLSEAWTRMEFPNHDNTLTKTQLINLFKQCDSRLMMDDREMIVYEQLPDKFKVYRGVKKNQDYKALSWTLDKDVAKWFSLRFTEHGVVYEAEIRKGDVFAIFLNRGEQEIVLNYKKLENVRALNQNKRQLNDLIR